MKMCKFKQEFITVFLKKSKERVTSMRSNVMLSVWINAEVFTYPELRSLTSLKGTISIKNEILIFRIQKCKIERETNSETCFHLFCQMHSEEFPFHL